MRLLDLLAAAFRYKGEEEEKMNPWVKLFILLNLNKLYSNCKDFARYLSELIGALILLTSLR
jgi:hypothetical protein